MTKKKATPIEPKFDVKSPYRTVIKEDGSVVREDRRRPEMQADGSVLIRDPLTGMAHDPSTGDRVE